MVIETETRSAVDPGLAALVMCLRFQGIPADPEQIRHRFAGIPFGVVEILTCAKQFHVKARVKKSNWERLANTPLPAIACLRDGGFMVLGKVSDEKALVQSPLWPRPQVMTRSELEQVWDDRLILLVRRAPLTDLARRFDITWFVGAIKKYRRLLIEVLIASFFVQAVSLVMPFFFRIVIDKVVVHQSLTTLNMLMLGFCTIIGFELVLSILRTYVLSHTTNRIDVELGARLFRHLLALPLGYFQTRRTGDSVARVRELENIRRFLTGSALTLTIDLFFLFAFLLCMFWFSATLTAITLAAFPFYIGISAGVAPLFRRLTDEKFKRSAENQAFLHESVAGVETLKAMAVEPQMQRRWEEQLAGYVAASFRLTNVNNASSQVVRFISQLTYAAILFFGAHLVISGDLTVGELVAFNIFSMRVTQPVLRLAQMFQDFHQVRASVARLGDILNTPAEPTYNPSRSTLPAIKGDITFEHVSFRYRIDGQEILHDVNFDITAGQIVGIVGSSGSGKSTIAKMVQRLYLPESGRILVDGIDLAQVDPAWLRRQIGVVLQENILFNTSVRENIALADPAMSMDRVIAAATLSGAHEFILEMQEGYDTIIGERGDTLSGGQRQRVAIARALVSDPKILIFDEATSALDYESERILHQNMRQICQGRTVIIIAHRLSTVRTADRIITIERGRVVEDGPPDELIRRGGRYANLYRLQSGISEVS